MRELDGLFLWSEMPALGSYLEANLPVRILKTQSIFNITTILAMISQVVKATDCQEI
jgi:hypothetical protein